MSHITKHIKTLSTFAALVFALGTSGVAVVIHSCTMTPVMECCQMMSHDMNAGCSEGGQQAGVTSIQSDMTCNTSTLVGGLTTNPAVVDNSRPVQKLSIVDAPAMICTSCLQPLPNFVSIEPFAESISPPSVDKHILNVSLLI